MDRDGLLALWATIMEGRPPRRLSSPYLRRILAFELQAKQSSGLSRSLRTKLDRIAARKNKAASPKLKPGGRLIREWNGVTHVVDVTDAGYLWKGQCHRSLSAIAKSITGAHWSGPRFFGLSPKKPR